MKESNIKRYVSYLRVSTNAQGISGLGLEAQRETVRRHVEGGAGVLLREYTEVESGKRCDRPALAEALKHCRMGGATLVIARFDRLARNVHFISGLMEAGVDFVACDTPAATRMTIHILAAVAEEEARSISTRTKAALAARKARGLPLGMGTHKTAGAIPIATSLKNLTAARAARTTMKQEAYKDYLPLLLQLRSSGKTLRVIAEELNSLGYLTRSGKPWNHVQVGRVLSLETCP